MLHWMTIAEAHAALKEKKISASELLEACLTQMEKGAHLNNFITQTEGVARAQAAAVDKKIAQGESIHTLEGIPGALKDLFNTRGIQTTSGSNMLRGFVPPYNATVVNMLNETGYVLVGKNNMDEFACGVSNETSAFGPARNPWDTDYIPGGSSGGSVSSVAAGQALFSLGTDTGGSIRMPAAVCGVVGFKPTYGRVSRSGVNAMASSFDNIGPITRSVEDAAIVMQAIAGHDPYDATTPKIEVPDYSANLSKGVKGLRIGVPKEFFGEGVDPEVMKLVQNAIEEYRKMGAEIVDVDLPMTKYGVAIYYVLTPGELSTNLARFDGVRFGHQPDLDTSDLIEYYKAARGEGFGDEIKRRIMMGTFVLSAGYADAYYKQAQRVRTLVIQEFKDTFEKVDVLVAPSSPTPAFKIGEKVDDPLAMYMVDKLTIPASSAGLPAMSIPCGFTDSGLPVGMQIMGPQFEESKVLQVAAAYEQATDWHTKHPTL